MNSNIFKKSVIGLVVLGFAGATYAAGGVLNHVGSGFANFLGTTPFKGAYIGGEGLYLQPRNGDLDYATTYPITGIAPLSINAIHPDYRWGYRIFGGFNFAGHEDLSFGYQQLYSSGSAYTLGAASLYLLPRYVALGQWDEVNGSETLKVNEAWGVLGHTFMLKAWSFRLGGGVEWAKVRSNLNTHTFGSDVVVDYHGTSRVNGWGPRGEFDMGYHFPYNVSIFANTNAALLVSSRDINLASNFNPDGTYPNESFSSRHVVVPKIGMRLGVGYAYSFGFGGGEGMVTTLAVAAGWQVENYIHAVERVNNFGFTTSTKLSNFSDSGLFLGVKVCADWL